MDAVIKTSDLPQVTDLTGATVIGLTAGKTDAQFPLDRIIRNNIGQFMTTDPAPVGQLLNQNVELIGSGSGTQPSGTYTNLLGPGGTPIVIPVAGDGYGIFEARAVWNGTFWNPVWQLIPVKVGDENVNKVLKSFLPGSVTVVTMTAGQHKAIDNNGLLVDEPNSNYQKIDASGFNRFAFKGYRSVVSDGNIVFYNCIVSELVDGSFMSLERPVSFALAQSIYEHAYNLPQGTKFVHVVWSNFGPAAGLVPDCRLSNDLLFSTDALKDYIDVSNYKLKDVLSYFIEDATVLLNEEIIPTAASQWLPSIQSITGTVLPTTYNKSLQNVNVVGFNKLYLKGIPFSSNNPADIASVPFILGIKSDHTFVSLQPGVYSDGLLPVSEFFIDIPNDVISITINTPNGGVPGFIAKKQNFETRTIKDGSVKEYIDRTLTASRTSRIFNVVNFGATGDGSTDDRIAIQKTINACFNAGGGKVFFPAPLRYYNLGTSYTQVSEVTGDPGAGHPSAQLIIPYNADTSKLITIELVGEYKPNMADEAIVGIGRSTRGFIKSGIIESNTGTALLDTKRPAYNTWGGKNFLHVHIENLIFRNETIKNSIDVDNKMSCINMENVTQFTFDYLKVETSSVLNNSVIPTYSKGVIMPSVSNKAQLGEGCVYVAGYYDGIVLGEHYTSNRTIIVGCVNGLQFPDTALSYHSASITHLNCEGCVNVIKMETSNQVLNIFNYDTEHFADGQKWFNYKFDINKTGGSGTVNIFNAQVTRSNVGNVNEFLTSGNPGYKILTGVGTN